MTTAVQAFSGTFTADPLYSWFGFSIVYSGAGRYRGTFGDVSATLAGRDDDLSLEGSARVESISIDEPAALREHLLGADFFDAAKHPEVTFRSNAIQLADDGTLRVEGELAIAGIAKPVLATGSWTEPAEAFGAMRAGLELETVIDRRDFGIDWQLELPSGRKALGWDVTLDVSLALTRVEG
jgi:polyisoprenoid-binding protein YceI